MKHLLFIIVLFASCTKEVSKPIQLRLPIGRPQLTKTVDVSFKAYPRADRGSRTGYYWTVDITLSEKITQDIRVVFSWDDNGGAKGLTLSSNIQANESGLSDQRQYDASSANAKAVNFKLIRVDGESNIVYRLKQTP